jgi:hypothetical protein
MKRLMLQLNAYCNEACRFPRTIHTENEPIETKTEILQQELTLLADTVSKDGKAVGFQVYDLLFKIAAQYDIDLNSKSASGRIRKAEIYC